MSKRGEAILGQFDPWKLEDSGTTRLTIALSWGWSRAQELRGTHDECDTIHRGKCPAVIDR